MGCNTSKLPRYRQVRSNIATHSLLNAKGTCLSLGRQIRQAIESPFAPFKRLDIKSGNAGAFSVGVTLRDVVPLKQHKESYCSVPQQKRKSLLH